MFNKCLSGPQFGCKILKYLLDIYNSILYCKTVHWKKIYIIIQRLPISLLYRVYSKESKYNRTCKGRYATLVRVEEPRVSR